MKNMIRAGLCIAVLGIAQIFAEELHKTYDAKPRLILKTVSGDCIVKTWTQAKIQVDLEYEVEPEDAFEPEIEETANSIRISEHWSHSRNSRVIWTLTVPPGTEIRFNTASGTLEADGLTRSIEASTASGDIEVTNSKGEFRISTASGNIELEKCDGEFEVSTASGSINAANLEGELDLSTASGTIEVEDCKGTFDLSCASGDIRCRGILIEEVSEFSTASGKVEVVLAATPAYDLDLGSASGRVVLDYNGNPVKGTFEFTCRKRDGRIDCPFKFDSETEIERNDDVYLTKIVTRGEKTPSIRIGTASGVARLIQ